MEFVNETSDVIRRKIAGKLYEVAPGETVDIPDRYAFEVKLVGLMLTPLDEATSPNTPNKRKRPCIEEFVHAGYKPEAYDTYFGENYGPGWSDPNWMPPAPEKKPEPAEKSSDVDTSFDPPAPDTTQKPAKPKGK